VTTGEHRVLRFLFHSVRWQSCTFLDDLAPADSLLLGREGVSPAASHTDDAHFRTAEVIVEEVLNHIPAMRKFRVLPAFSMRWAATP
jgi:hypothetical protein